MRFFPDHISVSGIQFAHDAVASLSDLDLEIYDRNPSLGGTWFENRYPGYPTVLQHQIKSLTDNGVAVHVMSPRIHTSLAGR